MKIRDKTKNTYMKYAQKRWIMQQNPLEALEIDQILQTEIPSRPKCGYMLKLSYVKSLGSFPNDKNRMQEKITLEPKGK